MAWPRLMPVGGDVLLAGGCVAAMHVEMATGGGGGGLLASATITLLALPVLVRRRVPMTAFLLSLLALLSLTAEVYNTMVAPPVICAYALASRRGRGAAIVAGAFAIPFTVALLHFYSPHPLLGWDMVKNLAIVVLPLALGVASHDRRACTTALVERAHAAEKSREDEARRRVGEERLSILRDVHDVIAHAMVGINVQAGVGAHLIDRDPDEARATLNRIKKASGDALVDLRSMLGVLGDQGGEEGIPDVPTRPVQALADVADLFEGVGSAGVNLTVDLNLGTDPLPASVDLAGYRIVQEALTNVIRYASPTTASVCVTRDGDDVIIDVRDDGSTVPAVSRRTGSGKGVHGMKDRATATGGTLQAGPRPGGGWYVRAVLPTSTGDDGPGRRAARVTAS